MDELHERDCAPCDAARTVVAELAEEFDPLDNWADVEIAGESVERRLQRRVAGVLHQFPLGGRC
jgi:hypothetical protein